MVSWFNDDAHFQKLIAEIQSWSGTPYRKLGTVKGGGTDCVQFVRCVLQNIGAIPQFRAPENYVTRAGGKQMLDRFLEIMGTVPNLKRIEPPGDIQRGDVLLFSTGKAVHHLAIVANLPTIWHCMNRVEEGNIEDPNVRKHLWAHYRVTA